METTYNLKMSALGYDELVCDIFGNWEDVKDELLLPERKQGSGNGTIHVFLGAGDAALRKEFSSYYAAVNNGEDTSVGAINVKHYFIASNVISMLGHACKYLYDKEQDIESTVIKVLEYISKADTENGLLHTSSLLKLSIGSNKLRPYFKQFESNGVFTKLVRQILLPSSSYKISLYKNKEGEYAAFWLLGFNWLNDFEADSNYDHLTQSEDRKNELLPLQQIFYGAPGTGKSDGIKRQEKDFAEVIRTTFHPDSDYSTFVGAYKPIMKKVRKCVVIGKEESAITASVTKDDYEEKISYSFVKQAFLKAYISAWQGLNERKKVLLVIEEINRGNCAQIFGDLFQLLDRETEGENIGYSTYPIITNEDLRTVLAEDFKDIEGIPENIKSGEELLLPPNLHIWATMNTSDQSLFPIDSAFKRRWDWVYKPIKYDNKTWKVELKDGSWCLWIDLQTTLNDLIYDATESEDKMLGDWFVKAENNKISEDVLVGKIVFYLWNDVAKVDAGKLFDLEVEKNGRKPRKVIFSDFYNVDGTINTEVVKNWLKSIEITLNEGD